MSPCRVVDAVVNSDSRAKETWTEDRNKPCEQQPYVNPLTSLERKDNPLWCSILQGAKSPKATGQGKVWSNKLES